jgi:hypothetical protein
LIFSRIGPQSTENQGFSRDELKTNGIRTGISTIVS